MTIMYMAFWTLIIPKENKIAILGIKSRQLIVGKTGLYLNGR